MHIVLVSREHPPFSGGGICTYIVSASHGLAALGHRVTVLTEWFPGSARRETTAPGVTVIRIPAFRFSRRSGAGGGGRQVLGLAPSMLAAHPEAAAVAEAHGPATAWNLAAAHAIEAVHRECPVDLVEAQEYEAPLYHFLQLRLTRSRFPQIAAVTHIHSPTELLRLYDEDTLHDARVARTRHMERFQAAASDAVCAPSDWSRRWATHWIGAPEDHVRLIRLPLKGLEELAAGDVPPDFDPPPPTFSYVGRVQGLKGSETLARAMLLLLPDFPALKVTVAGGQATHHPTGRPMLDWLRTDVLSAGGPAAQAAWNGLGLQPPGELWKHPEIRGATANLVPSDFDNSPYTCIEAMARGQLPVVSDNGGASEFVRHGESGFVFPSRDHHALADTLRRVMSMPAEARQAMRRAARARVLDVCATERVVAERADFYAETVRRFRTAGGRAPVPPCLPHADRPLRDGHPRRVAADAAAAAATDTRVSVVVLAGFGSDKEIERTHRTLAALAGGQRLPDEAVVIVASHAAPGAEANTCMAPFPVNMIHADLATGRAGAVAAGFAATAGDFTLILDAGDLPDAPYLAETAGALERHPEAGAVATWSADDGPAPDDPHGVFGAPAYRTPPAAQVPLLLVENCLGTTALVRRTAVAEAWTARAEREVAGVPAVPVSDMRHGFDDWDLWLDLAGHDWALLTLPVPLLRRQRHAPPEIDTDAGAGGDGVADDGAARAAQGAYAAYGPIDPVRLSLSRRRLVARHPDLFQRHAVELMLLAEAGGGLPPELAKAPWHADHAALVAEVQSLRAWIAKWKGLITRPWRLPRAVAGMVLRKLKRLAGRGRK